jgi:hypothetical protein
MKPILRKIYRTIRPIPSTSVHPEFGGSGITVECFKWITDNISPGQKILEFGAGLVSTPKLSKTYDLTSVEHDHRYIGQFESAYIYAELSDEDGWYKRDALETIKHQDYSLAIIDGPPGSGNRFGILLNTDLILHVPYILVDDVDRPGERLLLQLLAKELNRCYDDFGHFAVIRDN